MVALLYNAPSELIIEMIYGGQYPVLLNAAPNVLMLCDVNAEHNTSSRRHLLVRGRVTASGELIITELLSLCNLLDKQRPEVRRL